MIIRLSFVGFTIALETVKISTISNRFLVLFSTEVYVKVKNTVYFDFNIVIQFGFY